MATPEAADRARSLRICGSAHGRQPIRPAGAGAAQHGKSGPRNVRSKGSSCTSESCVDTDQTDLARKPRRRSRARFPSKAVGDGDKSARRMISHAIAIIDTRCRRAGRSGTGLATGVARDAELTGAGLPNKLVSPGFPQHRKFQSRPSIVSTERSPMDTEVLIVGAGPTGLMLANQLARRGVAALIIDRHAGPAMQTRALGVQARTLEIYSKLGIVDRALELGK